MSIIGFNLADPSMVTNSGKRVYLSRPQLGDICIEDIAHSLSSICRYNGHADVHYSVAEHSILVSKELEDQGLALEGLLHDAAEAYVCDLISPVKAAVRDLYKPIQDTFDRLIEQRFNANLSDPRIKSADNVVTWREMSCHMLFGVLFRKEVGTYTLDGCSSQETRECLVEGYVAREAEEVFLRRFWEVRREKR